MSMRMNNGFHASVGAEMANPYAPMGDHAGIALTSAAAMGISSADAAKSATTPQYGTYTAPELPSDNANFNNQFYSGPSVRPSPSHVKRTVLKLPTCTCQVIS